MSDMLNALTFDVEDWFQGIELDARDWDRFEPRLGIGMEALLSLLESERIKATFFVLGSVAQRHPRLVKRIAAEGHEVATHGLTHRFVYEIGREQFRREVRTSVHLLEDITGKRVLGHRAPFFSVTRSCWWAFEVLAAEGLRYDSSIFPVHNDRYGIPDAPRFPFTVNVDDASLAEFPISTVRIGRLNIPFSGGFYLRFWPYSLLRWAVHRLNQSNQPVVVYLHPWELDPEHPRVPLPRRISMTHYHNLDSTWRKLVRLLRDFRFGRVEDVLFSTDRARSN